MIDYDNPNYETNLEVLLQGMWYSELPELIDVTELYWNSTEIIKKIGDGNYPYYVNDAEGFIDNFKGVASPSYLFEPGVEAITYYAFKNDETLREMQIVNLIHYMAFVYNSLFVFDDLFADLYLERENSEYVGNSNSYVVAGESFTVPVDYDSVDFVDEGIFISGNNKVTSWLKFEDSKNRIQSCQGSCFYSLRLDIESFFPNLYTHYFSKIAQLTPFKEMEADKRYFDFLDKFHQRVNNNQTKGVPAGNFSSHIGAELLMLCVDNEIREIIKDKEISYIRYVDDMTFYSDNNLQLEQIRTSIQKILTKYRLRINGNKIVSGKTTRIFRTRNSKSEIIERFKYLASDEQIILDYEELYRLKDYIAVLLENEDHAQIKTILTLFYKQISSLRISFENEYGWFCYFLALVFDDVNLTCHIYKILNEIIVNSDEKTLLMDELAKKTVLIDNKYSDTLIQIWQYYVLAGNMDIGEKIGLFNAYVYNNEANPIILCHFVNEGRDKNRKLFGFIYNQYSGKTKETDWKRRIMFSKWWLPIFKIRMVDDFNYQNFMGTSLFPKILTDLAGESVTDYF